MADENKKDVQVTEKSSKEKSKEKAKSKKPNFCVRAGKGIAKFFKDFRGETKKIVWPDAKTVLKNSGVVIATVIIIGIGIWLVDFGLSELLKLIKGFADDSETTTAAAAQAVNFLSSLIK